MTLSEVLTNQIIINESLSKHICKAKTLEEIQELISDLVDKQKKILRLYNQCKQVNIEFPYKEGTFELHLVSHSEIEKHLNNNILNFKKANPDKFKKVKNVKNKKWIEVKENKEKIKTQAKAKNKQKFKNPYARIINAPMYS